MAIKLTIFSFLVSRFDLPKYSCKDSAGRSSNLESEPSSIFKSIRRLKCL